MPQTQWQECLRCCCCCCCLPGRLTRQQAPGFLGRFLPKPGHALSSGAQRDAAPPSRRPGKLPLRLGCRNTRLSSGCHSSNNSHLSSRRAGCSSPARPPSVSLGAAMAHLPLRAGVHQATVPPGPRPPFWPHSTRTISLEARLQIQLPRMLRLQNMNFAAIYSVPNNSQEKIIF